MNTHKLGNFEVSGSNLIVSDPCYSIDSWCVNEIRNVKPGSWLASIDIDCLDANCGDRISKLYVVHNAYADMMDKLRVIDQGEFGVDSGQAGVFDAAHYQDSSEADGIEYRKLVGDPWYDLCCHMSMHTEFDAGVLPHGANSSSGYGDGTYMYYCYSPVSSEDKDLIVAVVLDFKLEEYTDLVKALLAKS